MVADVGRVHVTGMLTPYTGDPNVNDSNSADFVVHKVSQSVGTNQDLRDDNIRIRTGVCLALSLVRIGLELSRLTPSHLSCNLTCN
jgi:hypothetical protein